MAKITLKDNPINTIGNLPAVGSTAPDFVMTKSDLSDVSLKDFAGKRIVLNIFPSLDTAVCASSVRKFNAELDKLNNTVVLCASMDLPFAHKRFCTTEGLEKVISISEMHKKGFGETYGVRIVDGPLAGIYSRAVVVINEAGKITYTEQVPEITQEPNYAAAIAALK
ncbi:MAG: thiol peroxidase [Spirochaetia bacterium]|nr:thiol peroxidase [Spirochaetia bacterium]